LKEQIGKTANLTFQEKMTGKL